MQQNGDTVREDGATVREGGVTVREGGTTVREGVESSPPPATPSQEQQAAGWLPPNLAADYRVIESLPARGAEADLYVVDARDAEDETRRVAKVYRQGIAPKEDVLRLVEQAEPAHVVRVEAYGQDADTGRWWELMEYVEQGSLRQLLEQEGPELPEDLIRDILRQLNDALASLHRLPLEHRDLKPGNVLVRSRTPLDLVLSDFGIASVVEASMHFTGRAQTMKYAPPEASGSTVVIERTKWDYWSLGMMLVEILRGEHPYDRLEDFIISNQLLTQNVEELTADVADPAWQKLCRGLLRRTPSARWDAEEVSKWLADPNDSSLSVTEEAAVVQPSAEVPSTATIDFDGARYATPEALGMALAEDWAKAESFWMRRFQDVRTWVTDGLGLQPLGDALAAIDDNDEMALEVQVFSFVYLLAPNAPTVRFRDVDLSMEGLAVLGQRAVNEQGAAARATLLTLYRQDILLLAGALPGKEALAEVARRWNDAVSDYGRRRAEFSTRDVAVPELGDDVLVTLLAGGIPVPAVLAALRAEADRANTRDARGCSWFRALGPPEDMSVAALSMLPYLRAPAERQGRALRTRPLRGCVRGIVVGGLFGLPVWWVHAASYIRFDYFGYGEAVFSIVNAIFMGGVIAAFYRAVVWDLQNTAGRAGNRRAGNRRTGNRRTGNRRTGTGNRRQSDTMDTIYGCLGCLGILSLPFIAILTVVLFTFLTIVVAIPSLHAMDAIGLIDFRLGEHRYRGTISRGFEGFSNPLLYVVPHALLGAVVGTWARQRGVIAISILALLVLAVVVNLANPTPAMHIANLLGL